jgi:mono/diheme cytochrome c family protein
MSIPKKVRIFGLAGLMALAALVGLQTGGRAQTPPADPEELGARLFAENCVVCHGENGQGRVGATLAKNWPSIRPDLTVKSIITNGVPGTAMPAWGQSRGGPFADEEIEALTQYILSWQTGGSPQITTAPTYTPRPPITPIPNVEGDPNRGAVLFAQNCEVCHGSDGQGRIGATLAKNWPGIRPDLNIRAIIQNGVGGTVMPAWSQANGGPLTEEEIRDLVAFILALAQTNPVVQASLATPTLAPPSASALSGWAGVAVFLVLFVLVVAAALLLQRRKA